jgi:hypothetical protein
MAITARITLSLSRFRHCYAAIFIDEAWFHYWLFYFLTPVFSSLSYFHIALPQ